MNTQKALNLYDNGWFQEASHLIGQLIHNNPEDAQLRFLMATTYLKLNRLEDATEALTEAIRIDPGNPLWPISIGLLHLYAKQIDHAKHVLSKTSLKQNQISQFVLAAIEQSTDGETAPRALSLPSIPTNIMLINAVFFELVALALANLAQNAAKKLLSSLIEAQPTFQSPYVDLASLYYELDQHNMARETGLDALAIWPDSWRILLIVGSAELEMGLLKEAKEHLKKSLGQNPREERTLTLLGVILNHEGSPFEAYELLRRALELSPEDDFALSNLGISLLAIGRDEEATDVLKKAASRRPEDPITLANLAMAYYNQGYYAQALEKFRQALHIEPNNKVLLSMRETFEKLSEAR